MWTVSFTPTGYANPRAKARKVSEAGVPKQGVFRDEARLEFAGTLSAVETRPFKRSDDEPPSGFGNHWNHNTEGDFLVGDSMGRAMVDLR